MNNLFANITTVVKNLIIINVIMFVATNLLGDEFFVNMAGFFVTSPFFKPWQVITHMFMHGSLGHIFFNMYALVLFGPRLENRFGSKKFLQYYMITGLGAFAMYTLVVYLRNMEHLQLIENIPVVGASGAVFGILLAYGMTYPNERIMLMFPPIPMKVKHFVLGYGALELYMGIANNAGDNTAHFAHLGGMLFGYLLIKLWNKNQNHWEY